MIALSIEDCAHIFNAVDAAIVIADTRGEIVFCNSAFTREAGLPAGFTGKGGVGEQARTGQLFAETSGPGEVKLKVCFSEFEYSAHAGVREFKNSEDRQTYLIYTVHCISADYRDARLQLLGDLAHHVVHELNQPLSVMRMASATAKHKLGAGSTDLDYYINKFDIIDEQSLRASEIVDQLRLFVPRTHVHIIDIDVVAAIKRVIQLLTPRLRGVKAEVEFKSEAKISIQAGELQLEPIIACVLNIMCDRYLGSVYDNHRLIVISLEQEADHKVSICIDDNAGKAGKERDLSNNHSGKSAKKAFLGAGWRFCESQVTLLRGALEVSESDVGLHCLITLPMA